jgi:hypothetical protein
MSYEYFFNAEEKVYLHLFVGDDPGDGNPRKGDDPGDGNPRKIIFHNQATDLKFSF